MNNKSGLKVLAVLHKALLLGQILFAAIAFYLTYSGGFSSQLSHLDKELQLVAVAISFAGVFIGASLFKKKANQLRDSRADVKTKTEAYRSVSIIQWALIEAPSLFNTICFMLTGNYAFLALAGTLILWFALTAPSKMKIMLLLRLKEEEMEEF